MFTNFRYNEIKLIDKEFTARRELVKKYLTEMDEERLMHTFRLNAGLSSDALPLGGWEAPECGLRGHFTGHFLSACAKFAFADDDCTLRVKTERIIDIMEQCQKPNGYLSAFGEEIIDTLELEENRNVWAPYYTLHKILQGLTDCASLLKNDKALCLAIKLSHYIDNRFRKLAYWKIDGILRCTKVNPVNEFGGIGDTFYSLYELTGEKWIMELAELFDRDYFIGNLANEQDILENLHSNTHLVMILAAMHRYQLSKEEKFKVAAKNFYKFIKGRTFANGNSSSKATAFIRGQVSEKGEHWGGFGHMADALTGGESESCCAHNTEKFVQKIFEWTGNSQYLDHLESLKYNAVLNSASSNSGLSQYHQPMGNGAVKKFSEPYDSFWCCTASGVEAMSELQKNIWFKEKDCLLLQGFISSTVSWIEKGMKITQYSEYPDVLTSTLSFEMTKPLEFKLLLRENMIDTVKLNGSFIELKRENGYLIINRIFKNNDRIEIQIRSELNLELLQGSENMVALKYGNLLLTRLGEDLPLQGITKENILSAIKRIPNEKLIFELMDRGGKLARFVPLFRIETEIYTVYMNLSDKDHDRPEFIVASDGSGAYKQLI